MLVATLLIDHPLPLASIAIGAICASSLAGVAGMLRGPLRLALAIAVPIVIINVLVSRRGLTVFLRLGDLGPFGDGDLTVEAAVYGAVIALKVGILILLGALASVTVDPDEMLRLSSALSFRSALTASLALRLVPLLAVDAQRLAEAQRTRPGGGMTGIRGRALIVAATVAGALDRAMDLAATLELRGLALARRIASERRPLSRHDLSFLCSAAAILVCALVATLSNIASFKAYPLVHCPVSVATLLLSVALPVVALAPFLDRRGVQ